MSDDLISRKALLEVIDMSFNIPILRMNLRPEHEAVLKIREIIKNMPTAFDKEEVIKELQKHSHNYYPSIDHYCTSVKAVKLRGVIDIIEKGR